MSNFEKALITYGLDMRMILLKIWIDYSTLLTILAVIEILVSLVR